MKSVKVRDPSTTTNTEIKFNDSLISNASWDISPTKPIHHYSNHTIHRNLEHAGKLQQLSEMDANLQRHIAQGGILHLASLSSSAEPEESNSCTDSSILESASVDLPQLKLKAIMRPVTDIQLTPPLLPILSPSPPLPEWNSHTLDSIPHPIFHTDIPSITCVHKVNLIYESIYSSNAIRRMRALRLIEECILLANHNTFLTFDLIISVISQIVFDKQWLRSLAESSSLSSTLLVGQLAGSDSGVQATISLSDIQLDNLWQLISKQYSYRPSCYSLEESSFLLSLCMLLTVDEQLDKCNKYNNNLVRLVSCLLMSYKVRQLIIVLRVVQERVTHHHTLLRLCSSVPAWNPISSACQVWLLLCSLQRTQISSNSHIHSVEDIYRLIPNRLLELLESYLSDRDMDQHCDIYKLHSELHMLYLVLKFSAETEWSDEQYQSLRDSFQVLSQMFRKYSLNLDGIKIKECIRHLITRVEMENTV